MNQNERCDQHKHWEWFNWIDINQSNKHSKFRQTFYCAIAFLHIQRLIFDSFFFFCHYFAWNNYYTENYVYRSHCLLFLHYWKFEEKFWKHLKKKKYRPFLSKQTTVSWIQFFRKIVIFNFVFFLPILIQTILLWCGLLWQREKQKKSLRIKQKRTYFHRVINSFRFFSKNKNNFNYSKCRV